MKYQEAVTYLNSFINFEKQKRFSYNQLKLTRVRAILKILNDPQDSLQVIKIAGTKGKGSTANYVSNILSVAGYKTGLYTSPHLHDFRERIKINNRLITKKDLIKVVSEVQKAIRKHLKKGGQKPTFFEVYTICAFYYFYIKKVDFAILETGLGGRLDATNVAKSIISIITSISYEHMDKLGSKLESIAFEKASIINNNSYVICSYQRPSALKVIQSMARVRHVPLYVCRRDFNYELKRISGLMQTFSYRGLRINLSKLKTSLLGEHQLENASCALAAIEVLVILGYKIDNRLIKKAITNTVWPGRLELIEKKPYVILDGAQNKASMLVLVKALKNYFKYKNLIFVLGISADKDIRGISQIVSTVADSIIITKSSHPRAASPVVIERGFKHFRTKNIQITFNVIDALKLARKLSRRDDLIICSGSLFVVAEVRQLLGKNNRFMKKI
jgi:dihydrofolate synthase/folylpolyglutamate synthase